MTGTHLVDEPMRNALSSNVLANAEMGQRDAPPREAKKDISDRFASAPGRE